MYISHRSKGLILYAFRHVRAVSRMNVEETGNNTFYKEFDTLSREVENNHIYIRRTYANFWQNIICLRSSSCLIRLHRVVYYFYAWRIWMVLELEGIGRRSHGKSEAAEKKRYFFLQRWGGKMSSLSSIILWFVRGLWPIISERVEQYGAAVTVPVSVAVVRYQHLPRKAARSACACMCTRAHTRARVQTTPKPA